MKPELFDVLKDIGTPEIEMYFAEKLYGYRLCKIGSDYDGKNSCEILTFQGRIDRDHLNMLPRVGIVPKNYLVPKYLSDAFRIKNLERTIIRFDAQKDYLGNLYQIVKLPEDLIFLKKDTRQFKMLYATIEDRGKAIYATICLNEEKFLP